jgi:lysophospholipase L1-like esterase
MKKFIRQLCLIVCALGLNGCENGGSSHDFGANNPNVAVAIGDSITALEGGNSTTYPALLAQMAGMTVINEGSGGATSGDGAAKVTGVLREYSPGYLLILYGANDVIGGYGIDNAIANLRAIIVTAKNNNTVPVIATITPMCFSHSIFNGSASALNDRIRQLASEEGCDLVDLEAAFGSDTSLFNGDGLHPNDKGLQVIADNFAGAL